MNASKRTLPSIICLFILLVSTILKGSVGKILKLLFKPCLKKKKFKEVDAEEGLNEQSYVHFHLAGMQQM